MYSVTESIVGSAVISSTVGVRQGLATSCFLFIIYLNDLIRNVKEECHPDGFLGWLHILMLMDDTVLIAASRETMIKKLKIVHRYCDEYGMKINVGKTKFFVINGNVDDKRSICIEGMVIDHCNNYLYLGSQFSSDGSVSTAVKEHAKAKLCHVLKFVSFVRKHSDVPFVKRRLFDAALMSTILHGCESWLGADLKPVVKLYNWAMKELLGVRKTTPNIVCYAVLGYPSLPDLVKHRQHKFFNKMWKERNTLHDDPFIHVVKTVVALNNPTGKLVQDMIRTEVEDEPLLVNQVHELIDNSDASRCRIYKDLNPTFEVHSIYRGRHVINDLHRMSFTRFRLSAHNLVIETGRWNRRGRGRLPVEERLCECGLVQTERHVIEQCPKTHQLRNLYGMQSINELFSRCDNAVMCRIIYEVLNLYD